MHQPRARLPWGRRIFLVDRDFQLKYAAVLACIGALVIALCIVVTHLAQQRAMADLALSPSLLAELSAREARVLWTLGAVALLTMLLLAGVGIVVTHRIAGPVYVMTQSAATLARGHYPALRPVRKHDDLKDFVELFQKSIESLRAREVGETFKLEQAILRLASYEGDAAVKEVLASLRALRDSKSAATGHLSASAHSHAASESQVTAPGLPLHLVSEEETGH
jgi:hypothetical protein